MSCTIEATFNGGDETLVFDSIEEFRNYPLHDLVAVSFGGEAANYETPFAVSPDHLAGANGVVELSFDDGVVPGTGLCASLPHLRKVSFTGSWELDHLPYELGKELSDQTTVVFHSTTTVDSVPPGSFRGFGGKLRMETDTCHGICDLSVGILLDADPIIDFKYGVCQHCDQMYKYVEGNRDR